jgi:hypothetical protein
MTWCTSSSVTIQTFPQSVPSTPQWLGEVVLLTAYLRKHHILAEKSRAFAL